MRSKQNRQSTQTPKKSITKTGRVSKNLSNQQSQCMNNQSKENINSEATCTKNIFSSPATSINNSMKSMITCQKLSSASSLSQIAQMFYPQVVSLSSLTPLKMSMCQMTPLVNHPQYLLSPSPIKKDLFSQLLSERKQLSPSFNSFISQMIQEEDYEEYMDQDQDQLDLDQDEEANQQQEGSQNDGWDQNGIKKRKRKSTNQIRMLKQELDGEMNWTKDKIVQMANVTGLSQSQVYKWCWDQKKKTNKTKDFKRKIIRKDFSSRNDQNMDKPFMSKYNSDFEMVEKQVRTKPKISAMLEESNMNTQKKINKKLVFF